ncbi:MAG: PIN domain-containing protein [Nanoarchaeota archaeon]
MRDIMASLPQLGMEARGLILLDTCFFIDIIKRHKRHALLEFCETHHVAMTSFNVEELNYIRHKFNTHMIEHITQFIKAKPNLSILEVDVHPGNRAEEKQFVNETDPFLLADCADPSDAVLLACAILTKSSILTKDKHHLFTVRLENYLRRYGIGVYKDFHSVTSPSWDIHSEP